MTSHLSPGGFLGDILDHPAFAGLARLILTWDGRVYDKAMPLGKIDSLLPYHTVGRALEFACWLFNRGPVRLRSGIASRCNLALSYLADEFSYENEVLAGHEAELDASLVRQHAMALAGAMQRTGFGDGEGVTRWIVEALPILYSRCAAQPMARTTDGAGEVALARFRSELCLWCRVNQMSQKQTVAARVIAERKCLAREL